MSPRDPLEIRALSDVLHTSGETYLREGDFQRSADFFRKSLEIRENLEDSGLLAGALLDLGKVLVLLGEVDEAGELVERARTIRENEKNSAGLADCHDVLGNIARGRGRPEEAESHYGTALNLKRELGDDRGMAATLALFGPLHTERGDYGAAEERYRAALAIFERVGDLDQVAAITSSLGTVSLRRGDLNGAAAELEKARDIFERIGDRRGFGRCLNNLASIYRALGKDTQSAETFRTALALFEEMGDRQSAAVAVNNLAVIELDFGNLDVASDLNQRSLQLKRELGDRTGEAVSLGNLAEIAFLRGDWERAARLYREAQGIQEEAENKSGQAWLHNHLARLALERDQSDRSAREAATARRLGEELGSREIQVEAMETEIRLALRADRTGEARRLLDRAEELSRGMRSRELEASLRRVRAEVLAAEGSTEEAEAVLDETARAFKRLRRPFDLARVDLARGRARARSGRGDRCVEPFTQAERMLVEIGASPHLLGALRESLQLLAGRRPGEGRELAEMGLRLALRLGDDGSAAHFQESLDAISGTESLHDDSVRRLRALGDLTGRLLGRGDPRGVAEKTLDLILEEVRGDRGILLVRRNEGEDPVVTASKGLRDPALTDLVRTAERVVETGETLRDRRGGERAAPRSRLALPFGSGESVTGVIHVESSVGTGSFTEEDERFAFAVGGVLALYLAGGPRPSEARVAVSAEGRPAEFSEMIGDSKRIGEVFETVRKVAPGKGDGSPAGGERNREGASRAGLAPAVSSRGRSLRGGELPVDPAGPARERALRIREGRVHRSGPAQGREDRARRRRDSLPRRGRGPLLLRAGQGPPCPAGEIVRAARGVSRRSPSTSGSWPPRPSIWRSPSRSGGSGRISTTGSTSCRSSCRRCASGGKTFPPSSITSSRSTCSRIAPSASSLRTPFDCSRRTPGRATSASWRMRSSTR